MRANKLKVLEELLKKAQVYTNYLLDKNTKTKPASVKKVSTRSKKQQEGKVSVRKSGLSKNDNTDDQSSKQIILKHQPKSLVGGTLHKFQLEGLNWLISLYELGINGILADEMGLGKTVQTIAFFSYLKDYRSISRPFLVVAPLSTINNWKKESANWLPSLKTVIL